MRSKMAVVAVSSAPNYTGRGYVLLVDVEQAKSSWREWLLPSRGRRIVHSQEYLIKIRARRHVYRYTTHSVTSSIKA